MTKSGRAIVLLDGGMGQEIMKRSGLEPTPLWSTRVMLDNPELAQGVHEDFIKAGAKIIALNNYTASRERLSRDASVDLMKPIHDAAINIAHGARSNVGDTSVKIAGCLGPLVASYRPDLAPEDDQCLESYRELVALQKDGVDLFMIETLACIREARAAAIAAKETGLTVYVAFTLDDQADACLRSGEPLQDAIDAMVLLGVDAVMVNCSFPETIDRALDILVAADIPTGAYANAFTSIKALKAGGTVSSLSARTDLGPDVYAAWGVKCVKAGLSIIGGCCETGPAHIAAIRDLLLAEGYQISSAL